MPPCWSRRVWCMRISPAKRAHPACPGARCCWRGRRCPPCGLGALERRIQSGGDDHASSGAAAPAAPAPGAPSYLTAVTPAWSRVGMPPVPPSPSATKPAPGRLLGALIGPVLLRCMPPLPLVRAGRGVSARRRGGLLLLRPSLPPRPRPRLQSAPMPTCRMLHPRSMPGFALLLPRRVLDSVMPSMRRESRLPRLRLSCAALLTLGALRLMLRPPRLMRTPLLPPLRPRLRLLLPQCPLRLRLRLRPRLLPPLRPQPRLLPLAPLWPALPLLLPLCLGGRVLLPPGGPPRAARTARAARRLLAGPSSSPRSPKPMRWLHVPSMGVVLPPLATPMILPALTFEGRPRRALPLPPPGLPW